MRHFAIRNWARFQHYKDRDPTWLKLHRSLLSDYRWAQLTDSAKGQLIGLRLIAARTGNCVPGDPVGLGNQIGANNPVDLDQRVRGGWIEWLDTEPESTALAAGYQPASRHEAEPAEVAPCGGESGELSGVSSDALALTRADARPAPPSREKRREEERREEKSKGKALSARAGGRPSFPSLSEEDRQEVEALAKLSAARRAAQLCARHTRQRWCRLTTWTLSARCYALQ